MFTNPIQTQTQAGASVPQPVQNNTVQNAISGLADIFSAIQSANKTQETPAYLVKEDWETEGSQQAAADIKQYKLNRETKGSAYAEAWRSKIMLERQQELRASSADKYKQVWGDYVGKPQTVVDREAEADAVKRKETYLDSLAETGTNLVAANTVPGYDLATLSREDAIAIARVYEGKKAKTQTDMNDLAYQNQLAGSKANEKTLVTKASAVQYVNNFTGDVEAKLFAFSQVKDPKLSESKKQDLLAWLALKEANVVRDFSQFVAGNGGDFSQVDNSYINHTKEQIKAIRDLVNGKFGIEADDAKLKQLALSNTLDTLPRLETGLQKTIYMNISTGFNNNLASTLLANDTGGIVQPDYKEAIRNIYMGGVTATENTGVPVKVVYDEVVKAAESKDPEVAGQAAEAVVASLQETTQGGTKVRTKASSPEGLPSLMAGLARITAPGEMFTNGIREAAAREGKTPEELWTSSVEGMWRETVAPSLQFQDPYVMTNIQLDYKNGRFSVKLNEEQYRAEAGLQPNISNLSGRDQSKDKINSINTNLLKLEAVLNNSITGYKKVMQESPDDVAAVMKARLELVMGINRINNTPSK